MPKQKNNSSFAQSLGLQILQVAFVDGLKTAQITTQLNVRDKQYGSTDVLALLWWHSSSLLLHSAVEEDEWLASWPDHFNLQERVPVPISWDDDWAPKLWGRDGQKNLLPARWKSDFVRSSNLQHSRYTDVVTQWYGSRNC